jgi:glutamate N-acetyltransferase / amino-acid N-acetyltransferase
MISLQQQQQLRMRVRCLPFRSRLSSSSSLNKNKNKNREQQLRTMATTKPDYQSADFQLEYAPIAKQLLPEGPWRVIPNAGVTAPEGFKVSAFKAGLRKSGTRADCALIVADEASSCAGVFTLNNVCAAPVMFCKKQLEAKQTSRAILINAGQANAATGILGDEDAMTCAKAVSDATGCDPSDVLLMSTGVIGRRIKMDKFVPAIKTLGENLERSDTASMAAATSICTTDIVRKTIAIEVDVNGKKVKFGGMSKGSGMIHPNMGTMLAVVTSDANVAPDVWTKMVKRVGTKSFNQISVDGDTSTNDTLVCFASGKSGMPKITNENSAEAKQVEEALNALCLGLAKAIAWDGEGATCLFETNVKGAKDDEDARTVARSVICSSLLKAAVFGHDPNWGRIACAAGYAKTKNLLNQNELNITMGGIPLMRDGQPVDFDEKKASSYLKDTCAQHGTVVVDIDVGTGSGYGQAWGCDLSYDYVKINADYTT